MSADLDQVVLGTAQFGLPYGRTRGSGTMLESVVHTALEAAWQIGIRAFDTSEAYGASAERLAGWLRSTSRLGESHVVTKVLPADIAAPALLHRAVARFAEAASIVVLSHGATDGASWRAFMQQMRRLNVAAGQSVYSAEETRCAAALGAVRVQVPANVFDLRQLDVARAVAVPVDVRSIYLQGVLLDPPDLAERRARGAGALAAAAQRCAAQLGINPSAALLAAIVSRLRRGDRVVVGVDDPSQVAEIMTALETPGARVRAFEMCLAEARRRAMANPSVLDPRTWA